MTNTITVDSIATGFNKEGESAFKQFLKQLTKCPTEPDNITAWFNDIAYWNPTDRTVAVIEIPCYLTNSGNPETFTIWQSMVEWTDAD